MHDMFSRRQTGVAIETGVSHEPGSEGTFDWLSGNRRDHKEGESRTEQAYYRPIWCFIKYDLKTAIGISSAG